MDDIHPSAMVGRIYMPVYQLLIALAILKQSFIWGFVPVCSNGGRNAVGRSVSAVTQKEGEGEVVPFDTRKEALHRCMFCSKTFSSRNALFRHVRSDPICSVQANLGQDLHKKTIRHSVALQFSYWNNNSTTHQQSNDVFDGSEPECERAGQLLRDAVLSSVSSQLKDSIDVDFLSSTQTSLAKMRHRSLAQENGCASIGGDVLVLSFHASTALTGVGATKSEKTARQRHFLSNLVHDTNTKLMNDQSNSTLNVHLNACKLLDQTSKLHAERSCSQRIYHYLLPLRWLPNGAELEEFWRQESGFDKDGDHRHQSFKRNLPGDALQRLKKALRRAESAKQLTRQTDEKLRVSVGRFGALGARERRPWHNFADPALRGDASPSNEPVWRVLDRARIANFFPSSEGGVVMVLEFRGDGFLQQQVRRLVGTCVAVTHGWLEPEMIDTALRGDVVLETPLAPEGHLYLAESRFHFIEMRNNGEAYFDSDNEGLVERDQSEWRRFIRRQLITSIFNKEEKEVGQGWLHELETVVAPRIRSQMAATAETRPLQITRVARVVPETYRPCLDLLRGIVAADAWPETSVARSTVIKHGGNDDDDELKRKRGSFSVVNPKFDNGIYRDGVCGSSLPRGNRLFPELVEAVFELEEKLSLEMGGDLAVRPASSHCAINCCAGKFVSCGFQGPFFLLDISCQRPPPPPPPQQQ